MTAKRRRACVRVPRRFRPCCLRSPRADEELILRNSSSSERSTMRRSQRLIAAAVLTALCGALAGCGSGGMANFDPSDMLDFLDTKKKLAGDRKPVFPRRRARPRAGRAEGIVQGLAAGTARPAERRGRRCGSARSAARAAEGRQEARQAGRAGCRSGGCARRGNRGGRARCAAAGAEAEEDRAPPHHRAATRRPAGAACGAGPADPDHATIRRRVPRAATERYV
jgi:predicted small lipoprotein YifL